MDQRERQVIDDLFGKIRQVAAQSPQRDAEAEAYIARQAAAVPGAPYYMAQALLVQEQALASAQSRIQQLEQQAASPQRQSGGGGGFLSGLFGGGQQSAPPPPRQAYAPQPQYVPPQYMQPAAGYGPWGGGAGRMGGGMGGGGGGFLAGAAQTAIGVAGGVLAAQAIEHAFSGFGGGEAHAAGLTDQLGAGDTGQMADQLGAGDIGSSPWGGQQGGYDAPQDAFDPSQDQGVVDQGYADPGLGYDDPGADDFGGGDFGNDDNTV